MRQQNDLKKLVFVELQNLGEVIAGVDRARGDANPLFAVQTVKLYGRLLHRHAAAALLRPLVLGRASHPVGLVAGRKRQRDFSAVFSQSVIATHALRAETVVARH